MAGLWRTSVAVATIAYIRTFVRLYMGPSCGSGGAEAGPAIIKPSICQQRAEGDVRIPGSRGACFAGDSATTGVSGFVTVIPRRLRAPDLRIQRWRTSQRLQCRGFWPVAHFLERESNFAPGPEI
jgi:hypothetical protein